MSDPVNIIILLGVEEARTIRKDILLYPKLARGTFYSYFHQDCMKKYCILSETLQLFPLCPVNFTDNFPFFIYLYKQR